MDNFNTSSFDIYKDISARHQRRNLSWCDRRSPDRKINVYQAFYGTDGTSLYE